jgi:SAM-dependent methyltransferase
VNRLVKRAVESHHRPADNSSPSSSSAGGRVSVLDAGCGIGGTLYGLLASGPGGGGGGRSSPSVFETMRYDGIAVSEAEVYHARALAEHHRRQGHLEGVQVRFERRSFDDPWDDDATSNETEERYYSAVIAVESLAYSRNLRAALSNLVSRLATGGIAVVADDVAMPRDADRVASSELGRGRPGLVAHATWDALLRELGCPLLEGYDLTFEHDLLTSPSEIERENACAPDGRGPSWPFSSLPFSSFVANGFARLWRWWGWRLAPSGPGAAARLVQLREDVADLRRSVLQRHQEHAVRGSLGYHLYVCRKV